MAKVLITGVHGFTGMHLARALLAVGHEVCGLSHRDATGSPFSVQVGDLLDLNALTCILEREQPDFVIHLAAIAFVAHGNIQAIYDTNVVGTRNLLEAVHASGCRPRSVLLASSANIYGNAECEVLDEATEPRPANDYAVSKLAMEYSARLWMDKLPITIVRPFNYTGVGQSENFLLPKIVSHFRDRRPLIELGNLDVVRDFSDVRFVAAVYTKLLDPKFAGAVFNVCSGTGHALRDVLVMSEIITGHRLEVRVNPAFVRQNEVHKLIGSNRKLREAIGELPEMNLNATLRWMLESRQ